MQQHVGFQLLAFIALSTIILPAQAPAQHAQTKLLDCPQGDCELLRGAPETSGMRSGFVRLHPGDDTRPAKTKRSWLSCTAKGKHKSTANHQ